MTTKYTKWTQNTPNGRKTDQIVIKINIYHCKALQNLSQYWDFWLENIPSGNPASSGSSAMKSEMHL
jgi:hypothetical protein